MLNVSKYCDFIGNEYRREFITTYYECSKRCTNIPDCTHFTWSDGLCFLKSGFVNKSNVVSRQNFVCGLYNNLYPGIHFYFYFLIRVIIGISKFNFLVKKLSFIT